jgi:hypothetical protein
MFSDFTRPRGNVLMAPINSILGTMFLGTCALWAAMFMWTLKTGTDPFSRIVNATVESYLLAE